MEAGSCGEIAWNDNFQKVPTIDMTHQLPSRSEEAYWHFFKVPVWCILIISHHGRGLVTNRQHQINLRAPPTNDPGKRNHLRAMHQVGKNVKTEEGRTRYMTFNNYIMEGKDRETKEKIKSY